MRSYNDVRGAAQAGLGFEFWNSDVPVTRMGQAREAEKPTAVALTQRACDPAEEPVVATRFAGRSMAGHNVIAYREVGDHDETSSYRDSPSGEQGSFRYR